MPKANLKPSSATPQVEITQQELMELLILQNRRAGFMASCISRQERIAEKLRAGATVENGSFSLVGTAVEVRA